jgi:hypothetical protein
MPNTVTKFNAASIHLQDTSMLYNNENNINQSPAVNKTLFFNTITTSKWYGPYKTDVGFEVYHLFSIVSTGDNKYYV